MPETAEIALRISSLCSGMWHPHYTASKLRTDPLYQGIHAELRGRSFPLLDIGCGLGILAMYLREQGWGNAVLGLDYDASKITAGNHMVSKGGYSNITLIQGDARTSLPAHRGDVTILDILQFFDAEGRKELLKSAAQRVAPGGKLLIRSGLRERNLRFFVTWLGDLLAKATLWMRAAPTCYPTAAFFRESLEPLGFEVEIQPFWGKTPFNNYLIVARRPE